jgi:hypothetical protein
MTTRGWRSRIVSQLQNGSSGGSATTVWISPPDRDAQGLSAARPRRSFMKVVKLEGPRRYSAADIGRALAAAPRGPREGYSLAERTRPVAG